MTHSLILINQLQTKFNLPLPAIEWLSLLFDSVQTFDDFTDGDTVNRDELNAVIWNTLVAMPQNYFFKKNSDILLPLVSNMILKWQAANNVEKYHNVDEKSFMWRAGYYDVALTVVQLCHGVKYAEENAHTVLSLYGETFEDYKKEFNYA